MGICRYWWVSAEAPRSLRAVQTSPEWNSLMVRNAPSLWIFIFLIFSSTSAIQLIVCVCVCTLVGHGHICFCSLEFYAHFGGNTSGSFLSFLHAPYIAHRNRNEYNTLLQSQLFDSTVLAERIRNKTQRTQFLLINVRQTDVCLREYFFACLINTLCERYFHSFILSFRAFLCVFVRNALQLISDERP